MAAAGLKSSTNPGTTKNRNIHSSIKCQHVDKQKHLQALEELYAALHRLPQELRSRNWTSLERETEQNIYITAEELYGAEVIEATGPFCD